MIDKPNGALLSRLPTRRQAIAGNQHRTGRTRCELRRRLGWFRRENFSHG